MAARTERSTVVGLFHEPNQAREAIEALKDAGFRGDDIGLLMRDKDEAREMAGETGTKAGEGAATGALAGGVLGGVAGWLVGIGALAIPGLGPFIAAGALGTALTGAAIGAGVGAVAGALIGMGIPEEEAKWYEEEVKGGRTLVTVKANGRFSEAQALLRRHGAYDIETRDQAMASERPVTGERQFAAGGQERRGKEEHRTVQLREEELRARRETREAGEATLRKDVVAERRNVDVPVTHEEVYVERHGVERRPSDRPIGEGETIDVPVREEEVTLEKRPVTYEEVEIGKRPVTETERVSGEVRREVANVETSGDVDVRGDVRGGRGTTGARFQSWDEYSPTYRQEWQQRFGQSGRRWQDVEPYHHYGYEMAHDPRYQGRDWQEVEPNLRSDYQDWARRRNYRTDQSAWDQMKDNVQQSWQSARAKVRR